MNDFTPLVLATTFPAVLVASPSTPARDLPGLIAHAKANPGKLNYGTAGIGGPAHLLSEMFQQATGTSLVHVPYTGQPNAMTDLMSGRIDLFFANMSVALPQVRAGKVVALGVTSAGRVPDLPDVPTLAEAGLTALVDEQWLGFVGPRGLPMDVAAPRNAALNRALAPPGRPDPAGHRGRHREVEAGGAEGRDQGRMTGLDGLGHRHPRPGACTRPAVDGTPA